MLYLHQLTVSSTFTWWTETLCTSGASFLTVTVGPSLCYKCVHLVSGKSEADVAKVITLFCATGFLADNNKFHDRKATLWSENTFYYCSKDFFIHLVSCKRQHRQQPQVPPACQTFLASPVRITRNPEIVVWRIHFSDQKANGIIYDARNQRRNKFIQASALAWICRSLLERFVAHKYWTITCTRVNWTPSGHFH